MQRQTESLLIVPAIVICFALYAPIWYLLQNDLLGEYIWWLLAWTLLVILYAGNRYLLWLVNVTILTNKRAVAVHYQSLFKKEVHEIALTDVRNIKTKTTGVFSSLFGFGTLEFEGGGTSVEFENIRNPEKLKDVVWKAKGITLKH